jgi:hypothetical protein
MREPYRPQCRSPTRTRLGTARSELDRFAAGSCRESTPGFQINTVTYESHRTIHECVIYGSRMVAGRGVDPIMARGSRSTMRAIAHAWVWR